MHSQGASIRIGIIDDNRLVREALTAMLDAEDDLQVVAAVAAGSPTLAEVAPDILLLDIGLGDQDSLALANELRVQVPSARIVVMDLAPMNEDVVDFVSAGISGFVLKDTTLAEFLVTIRAVAAGEKVLPAQMTRSLFSQIAKDVGEREKEAVLDDVRMTRREQEVIALIGEGLSNKEIATRLSIATHTVKSHVRNVMEKLALHTRLQIAAYSHRESRQ